MMDKYCHSSSILVRCDKAHAFHFVKDGIAQGLWAWKSADRTEVGPSLFKGRSMFDGAEGYVRLRVDDENCIVDYEVGSSIDVLNFRNMCRILDGKLFGYGDNTSIVSLFTWRLANQSDAEWQEICTIHEAEMFMIRGLTEKLG